MREWIWLIQLIAGMITAWIVMSGWFWMGIFHGIRLVFKSLFKPSVQKQWVDRDNRIRVIQSRTPRIYKPVEMARTQRQPKESTPKVPQQEQQDLSTMSKEDLTELLKNSEVRLKK